MNSLLARQINKYIDKDLVESGELDGFLDAINRSYANYEDRLHMAQHAMKVSSDELYEANERLKKEAESQKKIIDSFNQVVETLNLKTPGNSEKSLQPSDIALFIEEQTQEIIKINTQREELLNNLEKKNQVLSDYAHMVSHDLKSPLRSIDSLINWIIEDNKDIIQSQCSEEFGLILQNLQKMDSLINGILNYSTIDQAELQSYEVDIDHLVNEIKGILHLPENIDININNELPIIKGDKFRLQQLFQNLIQNAVKSIDKPQGKIDIGVKEQDEIWEFYIKDNGKGIGQQHYNRIFQIFEKIDNDQAATGIGLSIVKKIIDFYGGKIWLESAVGNGSTFYFTLPKNYE